MVKRILKAVLPLLVVGGSVAAAYAVVKNAPEVRPRPQGRLVPVVRTVTAKRRSVRLTVEAHGTVRPRVEIDLVPQVSGLVVRVSPSLVDGGFFAKGEVLVRIDPRDYELAVTQARAGVAQAEANLARWRAGAEIARKEWEEFGRGEPSPLALGEPQLLEAEAGLASAKAALAQAELRLSRTEIRAPFDGRVREERVDAGQYLLAGTPIATVYATGHAEVRLSIPDGKVAFLDLPLTAGSGPGRPVVLKAVFAGREHEWAGEIVRTEAEIDPRSRVVRALVRVKDPYAPRAPGKAPLIVGMYVRAEIPGRRVEGVVALPRSALRGSDRVLVVDGEDRLRVRRVTVLERGDREILVSAGLEEGERVCVTPVEPAVEGMSVRVEEQR